MIINLPLWELMIVSGNSYELYSLYPILGENSSILPPLEPLQTGESLAV